MRFLKTDREDRQMAQEESIPSERREHPRKHPRLNKFVRAGFHIPEYEEPVGVYLSLVDLSRGGMRVSLDRMWPEESQFELGVPLAGFGPNLPASVNLRCTVRWNRELRGGTWVHGLRFIEPVQGTTETVATMMANFSSAADRKHFRLDCFKPIVVEFDQEAPSTIQVRNLSVGGLGFRLKREFEVGQEFQSRLGFVRLHLEAKTRIQWRKDLPMGLFEYGCSFPDISEPDRQDLQEYIRLKRRAATRKKR